MSHSAYGGSAQQHVFPRGPDGEPLASAAEKALPPSEQEAAQREAEAGARTDADPHGHGSHDPHHDDHEGDPAAGHDERRMPFMEHIGELRDKIRNSVIAVLLATVGCWIYHKQIFAILARPLALAFLKAQKQGVVGQLVFISPVEGFLVYVKTAVVAAIFLATPVIFQQIWSFISPGLYPHEKRWAAPIIISAVILFIGGGFFCYRFVLPAGYEFFMTAATGTSTEMAQQLGPGVEIQNLFQIKPMISMDEYFGLTLMLLLVFGAVFELPLILSVLALLGVVTAAGLWRWNRYAILMFTVAGALLTPGDLVVGQLAMAGSLTVLYNLSILFAWVVQRRRKEADEATEDDGESTALTKTGADS